MGCVDLLGEWQTQGLCCKNYEEKKLSVSGPLNLSYSGVHNC